jgi:beta-lactamase regulating signal transducer with metallopeptidase domain
MTSAEILQALLEVTLASSTAILLVLALRRPLRGLFGVKVAYTLWWLVPIAAGAVLLPAMRDPVSPPAYVLFPSTAPAAAATVSRMESGSHGAWLLGIWLVGVVGMALWFALQQRAFWRGLGRVILRNDGLYEAQSAVGLPAVIGIWKPRIVVPCDFDHRYGNTAKVLLREHELAHIRHGDLYCNAFAALWRIAFWFNPLSHLAASRFRHDQELACDQRVISRHPQTRRAYGEAMLRTQLALQPLPVGCHWGYSHPLKERIAMLGMPTVSIRRGVIGRTCILLLLLGVGIAAWAAQPHETTAAIPPGNIRLLADLRIDGGPVQTTRMVSRPGAPVLLSRTQNGHVWDVNGTATRRGEPGLLQFTATIRRDGEVVATPTSVMHSGVPGRIQLGEDRSAVGGSFEGIDLTVTLTDSPEQAVASPSIRFDVELTEDGKRIPLSSTFAQFGKDAVIEVPGSVRIEAKAMPPKGDISHVSTRMYYYANQKWVLDFDSAMDANIAMTPSFEKTFSDGRHRVVLMPRKVN